MNNTIYTKQIDSNLKYYMKLIDSICNIINRQHIDLDELEQVYVFTAASKNIDFKKINRLIKRTIETKSTDNISTIDSEISFLMHQYYSVNKQIYIVDDKFCYKYPSEIFLHLYSVLDGKTDGVLSQKIIKKLNHDSNLKSKNINLDFFIVDENDFKIKGHCVEKVSIDSTDIFYDKAFRIFDFLTAINAYKSGDQVGWMTSTWKEKNGKKIWKQKESEIINDSDSQNKHYIDLISEEKIIYSYVSGPVKMSLSITKEYNLINQIWNETRVLQRLIG